MKFSIFVGDIADPPADAVCTSTNPRLSLVMGTGASIRARGGPSVMRACEGLAPLAPGSVHVTTAGELPHKIVIHCVASDGGHRSSASIVRACVTNALASADAAGCTSIAMPIFGTGHARLPFTEAARVMARAALDVTSGVRDMTFVTSDEERVDELRAVLGRRVEVTRSPKLEEEPESFWSDTYALHFDDRS
jgi:O-acetyl-ADP-ribose deacetylase (regulator of RNase III)